MRLAPLAPDMVETILGAAADQQVMLEKLEGRYRSGRSSGRQSAPGHSQIQGSNAFDGLEQSDTE